jgi:chromosome segregation ATPase
MTSAEIKRALKPMADFAPAVLKAAEIVEAAEAAEKEIVLAGEKKAEVEKQIATLQGQIPVIQAMVDKERAGLVEFRNDNKRIKDHLTAELGPLRDELSLLTQRLKDQLIPELQPLKDQIAKAKKDLAQIEAEKKAKLDELTAQIDAEQKKLNDAKQAFKEFRTAHGL